MIKAEFDSERLCAVGEGTRRREGQKNITARKMKRPKTRREVSSNGGDGGERRE